MKKNKKKLHKLLLLQIQHLCTFFPPAFSTRRNIGICNFDCRKINDITHLSTQYPWGCVNTMDSISCKNANSKNKRRGCRTRSTRLTSGCNYIVARQLQPRCVCWIQSVWTRRKCVAKQQLESVCDQFDVVQHSCIVKPLLQFGGQRSSHNDI